MDKYPPWLLYLENTASEELVFRLFMISFLYWIIPNIIAVIIISAIIFGLVHLIIFKWQMAVGAFILGLILGFVFLFVFWFTCNSPFTGAECARAIFYSLLSCTGIHYFVGFLAYRMKFTTKYEKK